MDGIIDRIHGDVRKMYETFPYPDYPLFVKLRWQEAYQATANFAASLGQSPSLFYTSAPKILIAGCGETQPYILRKIEPKHMEMDALDISAKSLSRAKTRLLWEPKPMRFIRDDIDHYLGAKPGSYDHIDCYGVLHHLANPSESLALLHRSLRPGGTLRLMVYNQNSRTWIYHIKRSLLLLGFDPSRSAQIKAAREFLSRVIYWLPNLEAKIQAMGSRSLANPARFVDTFFHVREARLAPSQWFSAAAASGFQMRGLFDRYGELDDLSNPLWQAPGLADLETRIADGRFENNFELYMQKTSNVSSLRPPALGYGGIKHLWLRTAPVSWFQYDETRKIPFLLRQKLWWSHIRSVYLNKLEPIDLILAELSTKGRQRLARIGAIHPKLIGRSLYQEQMIAPIWPQMEAPCRPPRTKVRDTPLPQLIRAILTRHNQSLSLEPLIIQRLDRAQMS